MCISAYVLCHQHGVLAIFFTGPPTGPQVLVDSFAASVQSNNGGGFINEMTQFLGDIVP